MYAKHFINILFNGYSTFLQMFFRHWIYILQYWCNIRNVTTTCSMQVVRIAPQFNISEMLIQCLYVVWGTAIQDKSKW